MLRDVNNGILLADGELSSDREMHQNGASFRKEENGRSYCAEWEIHK